VVEAEPVLKSQKVAIYARVSSAEHRTNLERQAERLLHYCEAWGYQVSQVVKEIASGANDSRPMLLSLLKDTSVTLMVVEHRDRLTRYGFHSLETFFETQGRKIEVVNMAENDKEDLIADLVHGTALWATAGQTQNGTHCAGIKGRWSYMKEHLC
jgi:predicted site-specific integrase-resolvase